MKKIIAVTAALMMASLSAFALDITVGARGNFNMGLGSTLCDDEDNVKVNPIIGGGFGVYGNFGLLELVGGSLGVQPEINMNFNNGVNAEYKYSDGGDSYEETGKYTDITVDIPVLVTFTYPVMEALSIGGGFGPYISIPFGCDYTYKVKSTYGGVSSTSEQTGSDDYEMKANLNFGLAFAVNGAYKVGPGSIALDIRYMLDLTPTKVASKLKSGGSWSDYDEKFYRRMLTIGAGYQIKF
ncbi:MAG: outer membrane beta-barrel protein [Treponema sp.]|nr:outer membrane beta-barrel protein [Treponema sp.]